MHSLHRLRTQLAHLTRIRTRHMTYMTHLEGQTVLYRLFDWMSQPAARLVVVVRCSSCNAFELHRSNAKRSGCGCSNCGTVLISQSEAIANTMDLPERLLPRVSRLNRFSLTPCPVIETFLAVVWASGASTSKRTTETNFTPSWPATQHTLNGSMVGWSKTSFPVTALGFVEMKCVSPQFQNDLLKTPVICE